MERNRSIIHILGEITSYTLVFLGGTAIGITIAYSKGFVDGVASKTPSYNPAWYNDIGVRE